VTLKSKSQIVNPDVNFISEPILDVDMDMIADEDLPINTSDPSEDYVPDDWDDWHPQFF
jgi:hypothetical protein